MESYLVFVWAMLVAVKAEYCGRRGDKEFYCEEGHCCGDLKCCTYYQYYKMWWFWLLWIIVLLLGCTCAYYRRHYPGPYTCLSNYWYAVIEQRNTNTYQHEVPRIKLPTYEEVIQMPQLGPPEDNEGAPPPYGDFAGQVNNSCEDDFDVDSQLLEARVRCNPEDNPPAYTPTVDPTNNV